LLANTFGILVPGIDIFARGGSAFRIFVVVLAKVRRIAVKSVATRNINRKKLGVFWARWRCGGDDVRRCLSNYGNLFKTVKGIISVSAVPGGT
jgi:hypothetical protein